MRRWIVGLALPLAALLAFAYPGVWSRALALAQGTPQNSVYFGYLQGTPRIGGVAIDLTAPDANGARILRAYVCDGLGPPEGMAVWFRGDLGAETFPDGADLVFTSAGGQEQLRITAMNGTGVYGAYTEASGAISHFAAYPAFDGAGIYQVTLDESLRYKGTSTQGATLDAQASSDGSTRGTITLADGKRIEFGVRSLSLADPALLAQHGLSDAYKKYAADNQVPGEYVAVIAPGGSHWFGRSGNVREGQPGRAIIGLDKKDKK
jgi:hypothetical protein